MTIDVYCVIFKTQLFLPRDHLVGISFHPLPSHCCTTRSKRCGLWWLRPDLLLPADPSPKASAPRLFLPFKFTLPLFFFKKLVRYQGEVERNLIRYQGWGNSFFFFLDTNCTWTFVILFLNFIYLFLAVLGLRFCARAFSSCGKRGSLFIAVHGPLTIVASPVAEHRLQTRRLSSCGSRA